MTLAVQLLLLVVILSLTVVAVAVGFQLFQLLADIRQAVKKLNRVLDHTRELSESAARPLTAVNSFFTDVKDLVRTAEDEMTGQSPDAVLPPVRTESRSFVRRFFRRAGLPLRPS